MIYPKLIFFSLIAATPLRALASESGGVLTLRDALALTLRESPELSACRWDVRAAEGRLVQARLRPNPELGLESENFTGSGSFKEGEAMENTLRFSQLIELGGKREARMAEARAGRKVADWEYQGKRLEALKATTQAFVEVLAAQRQVKLARENAALAEQIVPVTQKRVEAGRSSTVEMMRGRIAVASAKIELEQAERALAVARGNLAARWGAGKAGFGGVTGNLEALERPPSWDGLAEKLLQNPRLARWRAERERRLAVLDQAKAQGRPDLTLMAGPRMIGKGNDVTAVAGISLPLPFWNRNQGNIAEAEANVRKTGDERKAAEASAFAALNEAYQTLVRASQEVETLDREVLPGAGEAEALMASGYEAGRYSQLEVFDARRVWTAARSQKLRALADYHKAVAEIEALTAAPLAPAPAKTARNHGRKN